MGKFKDVYPIIPQDNWTAYAGQKKQPNTTEDYNKYVTKHQEWYKSNPGGEDGDVDHTSSTLPNFDNNYNEYLDKYNQEIVQQTPPVQSGAPQQGQDQQKKMPAAFNEIGKTLVESKNKLNRQNDSSDNLLESNLDNSSTTSEDTSLNPDAAKKKDSGGENHYGKALAWDAGTKAVSGVIGGIINLVTSSIKTNFLKKAQLKEDQNRTAQENQNVFNKTGYDPTKY